MLWKRSSGTLYPMDEATRSAKELQKYVKGMFDAQAALDTPEATEIKQQMASLGPENVRPFVEDMARYTMSVSYTHLTLPTN